MNIVATPNLDPFLVCLLCGVMMPVSCFELGWDHYLQELQIQFIATAFRGREGGWSIHIQIRPFISLMSKVQMSKKANVSP
jgi:hypothetical protein